MLFKTLSAAVFGIDAYVVDVEIDLTPRAHTGGDKQLRLFLPDSSSDRESCARRHKKRGFQL